MRQSMFGAQNGCKLKKTLGEIPSGAYGMERLRANTDLFIRVDPDVNVSVWPSK